MIDTKKVKRYLQSMSRWCVAYAYKFQDLEVNMNIAESDTKEVHDILYKIQLHCCEIQELVQQIEAIDEKERNIKNHRNY